MAENEKETKKKWGIALIGVPIALWVVLALANGLNFSKNWLGSQGMDIFAVVIAIISILIGVVFVNTSKSE